MKALFIGRFQPFHLGHLHAIEEILKKHGSVIIGIGSSQESGTPENPLSYEQRRELIETIMEKRGFRGQYKIFPIPDLYDDKKWVSYCLQERFDVVVSGNEWVLNCFKGIKNIERPAFLRREELQATIIRNRIKKGEEWEDLVPEESLDKIHKFGMVNTLKFAKETEKEFRH